MLQSRFVLEILFIYLSAIFLMPSQLLVCCSKKI